MKPIQENELTEATKVRLFNTPKMLRARRHVELFGGPKNTAEYIEANWPKESNKNKTAIFFHLNAIAKCDFARNIKLPEAAFAEQPHNNNESQTNMKNQNQNLTQDAFDPYTHAPIAAIEALAECEALDATLTWNGAGNYQVQAGEKFIPCEEGYQPILTRDDLTNYCDGELSASNLKFAAEWLSAEQSEWFSLAAETEDDERSNGPTI